MVKLSEKRYSRPNKILDGLGFNKQMQTTGMNNLWKSTVSEVNVIENLKSNDKKK